jgi:hypothetical protein
MVTETSSREEILKELHQTASEIRDYFSQLTEIEINKIPFEGSWTAAQLLRHVSKSTLGIAQALKIDAKPANRSITDRVKEFKITFLDYSTKMKSPDIVKPEERVYNKQISLSKFDEAFQSLSENSKDKDLNVLIEGLSLGQATKLELLHFVLYHTMRHGNQMKKIWLCY